MSATTVADVHPPADASPSIPSPGTETVRAPAALAALAPIVWGTTYIVSTEFLPADRPWLAAVLRALPAGLALVAVRRKLPVGDWWWRIGVLGVLNIGVFFGLLFIAAFRLPGGVAATMGALQPIVAAGLGAWLLGEAVTGRVLRSGLLGIAGVALLVLKPSAALDPVGILAALAATTSMALGVVLTKRWGRPTDLLTFTGWQLAAGGIFLLPIMLMVEGPPPALTTMNLAGFAWLGIVGTAMAYSLWFRGIPHVPVGRLTLLGLLSPLVATTVGWLVLDQNLTAWQVFGAVLVAVAVAAPTTRATARPSKG